MYDQLLTKTEATDTFDGAEEKKEPLETYEEKWIRRLSQGNEQKAQLLAGIPLMTVALYGISPFNPPNGNKGKSYFDRNHTKGKQ